MLEGEVDMEIMQRMSFSLDMQVIKERLLSVFIKFAMDLLDLDDIDMSSF